MKRTEVDISMVNRQYPRSKRAGVQPECCEGKGRKDFNYVFYCCTWQQTSWQSLGFLHWSSNQSELYAAKPPQRIQEIENMTRTRGISEFKHQNQIIRSSL